MVSTRLTELWAQEPTPSLKLLTEYQEGGSSLFPVDSATDCRDLFELSTGGKGGSFAATPCLGDQGGEGFWAK